MNDLKTEIIAIIWGTTPRDAEVVAEKILSKITKRIDENETIKKILDKHDIIDDQKVATMIGDHTPLFYGIGFRRALELVKEMLK